MSNYKVRVNNDAESKEVQELFFDLGYKKSKSCRWLIDCIIDYFATDGDELHCWDSEKHGEKRFNSLSHKELTIPQLRDLVVLKRNDVGDATHTCDGHKYYLTASEFFEYINGYWENVDEYVDGCIFEPIEKEMKMKEYLDKDYVLRSVKQTTGDNRVPDGWIEVPDGAVALILYMDDAGYWFDKENRFQGFGRVSHIGDFSDDDLCSEGDFSDYAKLNNIPVTWQRSGIENTKQPTGIEATLAERQATYGCFEDVARTTEQIMEALGDHRVNGLHELPYPHRMALYMIASKMARIVNGDFNHKDSWHDIGGYAKLVEDLL